MILSVLTKDEPRLFMSQVAQYIWETWRHALFLFIVILSAHAFCLFLCLVYRFNHSVESCVETTRSKSQQARVKYHEKTNIVTKVGQTWSLSHKALHLKSLHVSRSVPRTQSNLESETVLFSIKRKYKHRTICLLIFGNVFSICQTALLTSNAALPYPCHVSWRPALAKFPIAFDLEVTFKRGVTNWFGLQWTQKNVMIT